MKMNLQRPDRKKWLNYIKMYEDFNVVIPDGLKEIFKYIRNIVGEQKTSFTKRVNLTDLGFTDIEIIIDVDFEKVKGPGPYERHNIIYYSNIDIYDLFDKDNSTIYIPIKIRDIWINQDKMFSVISHEIRHIYDIYNVDAINYDIIMDSFLNTHKYIALKNNETSKDFKYFLYIVYLTLEHELIARTTMIYEMFINCNCSKEELYRMFEESFIYDSFNVIDGFNYDNLINSNNIINKINDFINLFGGIACGSNNDVIQFFQNWDKFFKEKSEQYKKEGYHVLDDLFDVIKENYSFDNRTKKVDIKDMLLDIHKNFIFKNKYYESLN